VSAKVPPALHAALTRRGSCATAANVYGGKGVSRAVKNVNTIIAKAIVGMDTGELKKIDEKMAALDGTKNKSKLGANAILSVSLAVARAGAAASRVPLYKHLRKLYQFKENKWRLPVPAMNILKARPTRDSDCPFRNL